MAFPAALGAAFLLAALVFVVFQHQSRHVWVTGATVNELSALAAAEAGIACLFAEVEQQPLFATHEVEGVFDDGTVRWGRPLRRETRVRDQPGLSLERGSQGTYQGAVGSDPYRAFFKVRAGYLPRDAREGPDGKRSHYLQVEAIGFRQDPTQRQDRATRVLLLVERSNFTEFLIYDGEWLTLGMGSGDDPEESNVFADGRLYGHQWVHLGNISGGTRQRFVNLSSIRSAGPIKAFDPFEVVFQGDPLPSGRPGAVGAFVARLGPDNDSDGPSPLVTAQGRILDGARAGALPPPTLDFETYRTTRARGGIDLDASKRPETKPWFSYPDFDSLEFVSVDFGRARYEGPGDDGRPEGLGVPYPADFNGVVFSSRPVVVWGNPDRDLTLVSTQDIFVAGDFNSREDHPQDYLPGFDPGEGAPPEARVPEAKYYTYRTAERFLDDAGDRVPPGEADRRACALVANGRVWRDARLPGRPFANELKGLLGYELGLRLAALSPELEGLGLEEQIAKTKEIAARFVAREPPSGFQVEVGGYAAGGAPALPQDPEGIPILTYPAAALTSLFPQAKPDRDDPDAAGRVRASDPLARLTAADLARWPPDPQKLPHYWTDWSVTKEAKIQIHQVLHEALVACQGKVTPAVLFGADGEEGLVDKLYAPLLADEARWFEFKGLGLPGGIAPEHSTRLALGNAAQRLYLLVTDEPDPTGTFGELSDRHGSRAELQRDRLYLPQQTINAMIFSNAPKNDVNVPDGRLEPAALAKEQDATSVDRRFVELGNPRARGLHYLSSLKTLAGSGENIKAPFIQRVRGAEIRLARGPVPRPRTDSGYYWPPIRRRIFDPDLLLHPPPMVPAQVLVKSWQNLGATRGEFQRF